MYLPKLSLALCWILVLAAVELPAAITDSLVGYWKFDEISGTNAVDSTTNHNHGLLNNFPTDNSQWVAGRIGGALAFRGPMFKDYVRVPNYPKATSNLTVAAWVWADARPAWATIVKNWGANQAGQFHFGLQDTTGDLSDYLGVSGGAATAREGVPFPLSSWQHVAFVADGARLRVYRNGAEVGNVAYTGNLVTPTINALGIGVKLNDLGTAPDGAAPGYWQGKMDELSIWARGLSVDEISAIYTAGLTGADLSTIDQAYRGDGVVISEFMAANTTTLKDQDGATSDWIEIHNDSTNAVNLIGWHLTDVAANQAKWTFPDTPMLPEAFLVVFASGKNRSVAGHELHTNFKLAGSGDYLGLFAPNSTNAATEFAPVYPPQIANVSYGLESVFVTTTVLASNAPCRAFVPLDDSLGTDWLNLDFDDTGWIGGTGAAGYETAPADYAGLIGNNLLAPMYNVSPSCYLRFPFVIENPGLLRNLRLRINADDGFVAYINGEELIRRNAPANVTWDSSATAENPTAQVLLGEEFSLAYFEEMILPGTNILAVQGLNFSPTNNDFLIRPVIEATSATVFTNRLRYFFQPTPGGPNGSGVAELGPIISDVSQSPAQPQTRDGVTITALVTPTFAPVASVVLHYRIMFSNEITVAMSDDGAHGDGAAGDRIYGAILPAGAAPPGAMLRYYVTATDTLGRTFRWPLFGDPTGSAEYFGTIMANPALTNPLPVLQWFVANTVDADTAAGTRASLFYDGEFYDNVFVRIRGNTSRGWPKKSYKFDFNDEHHFSYDPNQGRVSEININTTWTDKSYVRALLAWETYRDSGAPHCVAFPLRLQRNGVFFSVAHFVEQPNKDYLARLGRSRDGALYKAQSRGSTPNVVSDFDKKNRRFEDNSDLQAFLNGLALTGTNRTRFLFDNVDIPEVVNYMAACVVIQNIDRTVKNYYLYRDSAGNGEWQMFPWDVDLSFGPNALNTDSMDASNDTAPAFTSHPFFGTAAYQYYGLWNRLLDDIITIPQTREMFLRRLRSQMDQFLDAAQLQYEHRIDELITSMAPDVALDYPKWGPTVNWGAPQTMAQAIGILENSYLVKRRPHLFTTHNINNPGYAPSAGIPNAQPLDVQIHVAAVEFNPVSGKQAEEFIQLSNSNNLAVDLSGWKLSGTVDYTFQPGVVMSSMSVMYVSPDVVAFRARGTGPGGGQGLFVQGNYQGQLSARGGLLQLFDRFGQLVSSFAYPGAPSPAQLYLRITEIMYHPPPPPLGSPYSAEDFEYLELKNIGAAPLDLTGLHFSNGVEFTFTGSDVTELGPGQVVLVVRNAAAFLSRYGSGFNLAGQYLGALNNGGETLRLDDAVGEKILEFACNNSWYPITDGLGFSLVIQDENAPWDTWGDQPSWRPSARPGGSPGLTDPTPAVIAPVLINEALTRTDFPPPTDSIELFNPTASAVDLGGWFLSDDFSTPKKFRIGDGTTIPAGGFVVFDESLFNPNPGVPPSFSLSSEGDAVYLFSGDANTNLSGYMHGFAFGAAEDGVSFGRYVTSVGEEHFVSQLALTLGAANAGPKVGPVVLNEIMYHPPDNGTNDNTLDEYIELVNISNNTVPLFDPVVSSNTWKLTGGVDFQFPTNQMLGAGEYLLVANFNPATDAATLAAFRAKYNVAGSVQIFGPYGGKLNNDADNVELRKPTAPRLGIVPYVLVDKVAYRASAPWPAGAGGFGLSLQRSGPGLYGDDPANWVAAPPTAAAAISTGGIPPVISRPPSNQVAVANLGAFFSVAADGTAPLSYQWRFNGVNLPGATNSILQLHNVQPNQSGDYQVAVYNTAGSTVSATARLTLFYPAAILFQPQTRSVRLSSLTNVVSTNITFSVSALSSSSISYQWRFNGANISDATNTAYTLLNVGLTNNGSYQVLVTDAVGSVLSDPAALNILIAPAILQPLPSPPTTLLQGDSVTYTLSVIGFPPPFSYSWRRGSTVLTNITVTATNVSLTLNNLQPSSSGLYRVVITNVASLNNTVPANSTNTLTVLADSDGDRMPDAWEIAYGLNPSDPNDASADADGDGLTNLQEYIAGTNPTNASSYLKVDRLRSGPGATIQFTAVSNKTYTIQYKESVANGKWAKLVDVPARSSNRVEQIADPFPLTRNRLYRLATPRLPDLINPGPAILSSPQSIRATAGDNAQFDIFAVGTGPVSYQWRFNGSDIAGATASNLTVTDLQLTNVGSYVVLVSDQIGSQTSDEAILALKPVITSQPQSQSVAAGATATFNVQTTGTAPLQYRWRHNRILIVEATNAVLSLGTVRTADAGNYAATITHLTPLGILGIVSSNAVLTVLGPP